MGGVKTRGTRDGFVYGPTWWFAAWVAAASVVTSGAAVFDKSRAQRGGPRVRERTLLLAAFVGGSPGLVVAMLVVRHKTRKASFLLKLALVLVLQGVALVLLWRSGFFSET